MKKYLLLGLILCVANSCFAVEFKNIYNTASMVGGIANSKYQEAKENKLATQNTKQQKAEKGLLEELATPERKLEIHYLLLREDKRIFDANEGGETIYSQLISFTKGSGLALNCEYALKAKKLFDEIAEAAEDDKIPTPTEFEKKKIFIPDSDFDKINDDLKEIIYMLNCY